MSACGLLVDPSLFDANIVTERDMQHSILLAREYLEICRTQPTGAREIRDHLLAMFRHAPGMEKEAETGLDATLRNKKLATLPQFSLFLDALEAHLGLSDGGEVLRQAGYCSLEEILNNIILPTLQKNMKKKKKKKKANNNTGRWVC